MTLPHQNLSIKKLLVDLVYFKIEQNYLNNEFNSVFGKSIDNLLDEGCNNFIMDFSKIDFLDSDFISLLLEKMKLLAICDGSLRLVVMEDKPRLKFSINDSISKLNLFLSKENALQDFFN